jgi:hypothetical protein
VYPLNRRKNLWKRALFYVISQNRYETLIVTCGMNEFFITEFRYDGRWANYENEVRGTFDTSLDRIAPFLGWVDIGQINPAGSPEFL